MTGWRVGYVYAQEKLIEVLTAINSQSISNIPVIAQYAAIYAIKNETKIAEKICKIISRQKILRQKASPCHHNLVSGNGFVSLFYGLHRN